MAKAFALFSVPSLHETHLYKRNCISRNSWEIISYPRIKLNAPLCSPSSTAVVEDGPSSPDALPVQSDSAADDAVELPQSGCRACGREEIEKGCNGKGGSKVGLQQYQDLDGGLLKLTDLVLDSWLPVGGTGVKDKVWMKLSLEALQKLL